MSWGGAEEQRKEREEGNLNVKNWQDEALKVVEKMVSVAPVLYSLSHSRTKPWIDGGILWKVTKSQDGRSTHPGQRRWRTLEGTLIWIWPLSPIPSEEGRRWRLVLRIETLLEGQAGRCNEAHGHRYMVAGKSASTFLFDLLSNLASEACRTAPNPFMDRPWCPPMPGIFGPLWTSVLGK